MKQVNGPMTGVSEFAVISPHLRNTAPRKKNQLEERGLWDYLHMLRRRWRLSATLAIAIMLVATGVILTMPASYRADVLVVLQPPSVTTGQAVIIQPDFRQKLDALREQVESRRTLQEVIKKFDLHSEHAGSIPQDEIFEMVRSAINLKLGKSAFTLYFEHPNPQIAADVANELARYYIEENARLRRRTLEGTSKFINTQLKRLEKEVQDMDKILTDFRKKHMGSMPEDVPANQALLTSLSTQVAQTEASLEGERLRKRKIEAQVSEMLSNEIASRQKSLKTLRATLKQFATLEEGPTRLTEDGPRETVSVSHKPSAKEESERELRDKLQQIEVDIAKAKAAANQRYPNGESPEVIRLKNERRAIEAEIERAQSSAENPTGFKPPADDIEYAPTDNIELEMLRQQLHLKTLAARDAERNVEDMENMVKRGLIAERLAEKARAERDRFVGELRIHRTNIMRARNKYADELKNHENEIAGLQEFQSSWDEMLVKAQEIEAQRMRINSGSTDEELANINKRIERLTTDLAAMRKKQTEASAAFFSSHGELAREVQEHENVMANLTRQQSDIQTMKTRVIDLDRKLTSSARVLVEYPEMQRKYRTVTDQYETMLRHQNQAEMERGVEDQMEGERMVIWDPAIPTSAPYKPKYVILFGGALAGSLSIAIALALLLELMSPKFLNSDVLQDYTGHQVLARFDNLSAREIPSPLPQNVPLNAGKIVPLYNPRHRLSKQFLDCSCLLFKSDAKWPRVVAVCSPGTGDGKTFVASNLASALAISNHEPTLLVDANLRSPALHTLLGKPLENGLAEALEGGPVTAHPIGATLPSMLQLVTAGCAQRYGAVLLGSRRFREIMDKLTYEGTKPRIILDTPALSTGADVDVLLDSVDGVLLVVRRGHTSINDVNRALRRIPPDKLVGIVFNGNVPKQC